MRTGNFFAMALLLGLMLYLTLIAAPTADAQTLGSGAYQVQVRNSGTIHRAVWRLQVSGNQITGMSDWGTRVDPMQGYIQSNRVVIQRDCRGQGFPGECRQVYQGVIGNGIIQGSFSGTGAAPNNVWTLYLGAPPPPPPPSGIQGSWRYSASCSASYHAGSWNGVMSLNLGADGKYSGKANGSWVNTNSADIGGGTLQSSEVTFTFNPTGWTSYYIWKGRLTSDGRGVRIEGTAYHGGNACNFTMTR